MDKERKKALKRRLAWWGLRAIAAIVNNISLRWVYIGGSFLGNLGYFFIARYRDNALDSLRIAFPHLKEHQRRKIARRALVFMAQSSLEAVYSFNNFKRVDDIRVEGKEFLDRALKLNKGVVGLTAHFGNFPLMSLKFAHLGYSAWTLVRPMRDEKADYYMRKLRKQVGMKSILSYPRRECVAQIIKALRDNGVVMVQMDQNFGTGGVWVKFFNELAATPVGPVVFALRTNAVVLPMYILREGMGKHLIKIFPPLELEVTEDKDETVLLNAIKFTQVIEGWVRETPTQWGWIHRRWKSKPSKEIRSQRFKVQND